MKYFVKSISTQKLWLKILQIQTTTAGGSLRKILEGEMLIRTLPTTLLQKCYEVNFNLKVIIKSVSDPDDNFW